ncbi:tryptophan 7-halogenase [Thalassotalea litorea]|uniref:Tryptophan 7-halogenase n=1 Tax=Thalassotalea litorea TaxID=2020715 RepID=A0A5R9IYZ6_9GAMM|nr:tryptophan halogenase family protein [Thalassotalea litorea]TLU67138.1 tryptophan 7-halogenase [Thalassotalea litorea]
MVSITKKINSILIVGGGTSGWMTAAALSHHFQKSNVSITLVESSQLGTIGVGEATIPTLRRFYQKLGLTDLDVLKATSATCKLGIEFKDWYKPGSSFIHPFGLFGQGTQQVDFHHYWLRAKQHGDSSELADYSLGVSLAQQNKFKLPAQKPKSQLEVFDWALHFDAAKFAELMRDYAQNHGVKLIDDKIIDVDLNSVGEIDSVTLESKGHISADLFIDCSGFKGLLINQTLKTEYIDWSQWLVCDRAVAVQSKSVSEPLARTVAQAHGAGWQWKIPLQHRTGNGHVYSSQYISEDEATTILLENVEGELLQDPRHFSFVPGRREKAWNKNCIAVGLSSGFLEPLESTSIALVETAIEKIILSLPKPEYSNKEVARFNEVTALEYERVRDFIILHYKATQRDDSPMWRYCQNMAIPKTLEEKYSRYKECGDILRYPWDIFGKDSWLAIFSGFHIFPNTYNSQAENMPLEYLQQNLSYMKKRVAEQMESAESHTEFLRVNCKIDI